MTHDLRAVAEARHNLHNGKASSRPLTSDYQLVGIAGEQALAEFCGGEVDVTSRPGGDGGIDCHIALWFSVDVKTSKKGLGLLVEAGKVRADIYVLAHYHEASETATLLGWEWGKVIKQIPPKDWGGHGIISHSIPRNELRPMDELKVRITRRVNE